MRQGPGVVAVAEQEVVELTVSLHAELRDELEGYCRNRDASPSWTVKRALRLLFDEEATQDQRLRTLSAGKRQRSRSE